MGAASRDERLVLCPSWGLPQPYPDDGATVNGFRRSASCGRSAARAKDASEMDNQQETFDRPPPTWRSSGVPSSTAS